MAVGPQPANKSVILDYISPISLTTLYQAVKNSHYKVFLVVMSSLLLKALTIFSTGLFTLQPTNITSPNATLLLTSKFDGSQTDFTNVDGRPATIVYGAEYLGLQYPSGTTSQYAIQSFSNPSCKLVHLSL